ncbi:hypothetical protein [Streptomyces hiroshimensis]|uniref:PE-PGRS family protein n=1 Tax=Streptomyces hiroshimensis TaxID=66424 RepID=A0ABQ2YB44_9ACTN|nr:hypothetical protein [Streptomyces hiroshimensis]GGX75314.1 hypothetical protein GCM10010324_20900 [Streptomyces hiroshimensis]
MDRVEEHREAAAQAEARETPEEREAAWDALFRRLTPTERLRREWANGLAFNEAADEEVLTRLTGLTSHHFWRDLPAAVIDAAVDHPSWRVRGALVGDPDPRVRAEAALLPGLRASLASNPHLDPDLVTALADDEDDGVRFQVSVRPDLTEEQRAAVRVDIDPSGIRRELAWVRALHGDPEAMRRCAASSRLLVRSGAARAKRLPPDAVALLARDEDRVVRLFLAEFCDDAPADMLLEVWSWWSGSLSHPGRPRTHPNFPRRGLLRYAEVAGAGSAAQEGGRAASKFREAAPAHLRSCAGDTEHHRTRARTRALPDTGLRR